MDDYAASVLAWRRARDEEFRRADGWLSQVALHWFEAGRVELDIGAFVLSGDTVCFCASAGIEVRLHGVPVTEAQLPAPAQDSPDVLAAGTRRFQLVRRGADLAVRERDLDAPLRTGFRGLVWYPVDPAWRIVGRFVADDAPRPAQMRYTAGQTEEVPCPGQVVFAFGGQDYRLRPYVRPDGSWLFVFRDDTNADETCALCRYFYAEPPDAAGHVVLDFNRAAAPICAFVPFVTCVLPPPENRLALRVEAGERRYTEA
jgi:uncharacterized protein (DUF1684 family)